MIYFDNAATTRPSPAVIRAMTAALEEDYGNPSSTHALGVRARKLTEDARQSILSVLFMGRAAGGKLIFTGSGTEGNNLAILGAVYAKNRPVKNGSRGTILLSDGEHASVSVTCQRLEKDGFTVKTVPTTGGKLDLDALREMLTPEVILLSVMLVNNETGALYAVREAADLTRRIVPEAVIHTDAVQGFMKVPMTPVTLGADLVTVSAHKIAGPKGIGALYVTDKLITRKNLIPLITGGGQENAFRSGTLNVPGILGFAAAAKEALATFDERTTRLRALRETLEAELREIPGVRLNLPPEDGRVMHILNITLPSIKSETMLNYLSGRGILISAGSACSSHGRHASPPLAAFGLSLKDADCSVRISLSHLNTEEEIGALALALCEGVTRLARIR